MWPRAGAERIPFLCAQRSSARSHSGSDTMATLRTQGNIADPDAVYAALIDLHRDLTEEQSRMVNAKLILLLANEVGDMEVLGQAMAIAREGLG